MSIEKIPAEPVSTYTYQIEEQFHEGLLIRLPKNVVGTENTHPPPSVGKASLSNWVRGGYFLIGDFVMAPLPRKASLLPLEQEGEQVTDVFHHENAIKTYYPETHEKAVCVTWDYPTDEWSASHTECTFENGRVSASDAGPSAQTIWSLAQSTYMKN